MRINRETLLRIARDTVSRRTRSERGILAAYLCGTLLGDDYLLGGTVDIDLAFIHVGPPNQEREIIPLTDQVHLDIAHYDQAEFRNPRDLRMHPWMGPTLFNCQVLFDPQHFLDFTQASVRGQYHHSENVLKRIRGLIEHARQIWMAFYTSPPEQPAPVDIRSYLHAIEHATNGIASLTGVPLTDRRLAWDFKERAEAAKRPGLYPALLGMLGAHRVEAAGVAGWLDLWEKAYTSLDPGQAPPRLHPARLHYYRRGMEALLSGPEPMTVLWPLLRTWTLVILAQTSENNHFQAWHSSLRELGLIGEEFAARIFALDAYLDTIEEALEGWARRQGVTSYP